MGPALQRRLTLTAVIGLAYWLFGNLYEAVVFSPNWVPHRVSVHSLWNGQCPDRRETRIRLCARRHEHRHPAADILRALHSVSDGHRSGKWSLP